MNNKNHIKWIDGLKGIACMAVYSGHFMGGLVPAAIYGTNDAIHSNNGVELVLAQTPLMVFVNGNFFVFIFSILSGFTIGIKFETNR